MSEESNGAEPVAPSPEPTVASADGVIPEGSPEPAGGAGPQPPELAFHEIAQRAAVAAQAATDAASGQRQLLAFVILLTPDGAYEPGATRGIPLTMLCGALNRCAVSLHMREAKLRGAL